MGFDAVMNIIRWDIYLFIYFLFGFKQSRRIFYIIVKFEYIYFQLFFFIQQNRHEISLFIVYIIIFFSLSLAPPLSLSSFTQTTKKLELPLKNTTCKKKKKKKPKVRQTYLRFSQGKSTKNPELEQMVQ
jgi:hypothetical protein